MDVVKEFLIKNGFAKTELNHYVNYTCEVVIMGDCYNIIENSGSVFSDNLNIYWLIGYLTYYNFIDKDYVL